jgi:hypothetical protein
VRAAPSFSFPPLRSSECQNALFNNGARYFSLSRTIILLARSLEKKTPNTLCLKEKVGGGICHLTTALFIANNTQVFFSHRKLQNEAQMSLSNGASALYLNIGARDAEVIG